jgi:hypothetical protein
VRGKRRARGAIGREKRIAREEVLEVGEDQLLVLLLVVAGRARRRTADRLRAPAPRCEESADVRVDVRAIGENLESDGREMSRARARVLAPDEVVIELKSTRKLSSNGAYR